jgi:hypothetical protein
MSKFRKKPVVIEAVQLTWANWGEVCEFVTVPFVGAYLDGEGNIIKDSNSKIGMVIYTLEGEMLTQDDPLNLTF